MKGVACGKPKTVLSSSSEKRQFKSKVVSEAISWPLNSENYLKGHAPRWLPDGLSCCMLTHAVVT